MPRHRRSGPFADHELEVGGILEPKHWRARFYARLRLVAAGFPVGVEVGRQLTRFTYLIVTVTEAVPLLPAGLIAIAVIVYQVQDGS